MPGDILNRIHNWLSLKLTSTRMWDTEGQKVYLAGLPAPETDAERSYCQYKCQMYEMGPVQAVLYQGASLVLLAAWSLRFLFRGKKILQPGRVPSGRTAVFLDNGARGLFSEEFQQEFPDIRTVSQPGNLLDWESWRFFSRNLLRRYPFSWHFLAKCLIKMTQYASMLQKYDPEAIITCNEYSFTSSFLTAYCSHFGCRQIDVMHGEKLYNIRDSFFRYDQCWVWDAHYVHLLTELGADASQFRISVPPCLMLDRQALGNTEHFDFTYYLQQETDEQLRIIAQALHRLQQQGYRVAYRPHPVYENPRTQEILQAICREEGKKVSIAESVMGTGHVISRYSTVLYQAHLCGIPAVIDDLTDPELYEKLHRMDYIMLAKDHELLSQYGTTQAVSAE